MAVAVLSCGRGHLCNAMTLKKIDIGILALALLCLAGIAMMLNTVSLNQSSTLEQMLPVEDLAQVDEFRRLFHAESEPVLVALQGQTHVSSKRVVELENSLRALSGVTETISSASAARSGLKSIAMLTPARNTELVLVMISPESRQLAVASELAAGIDAVLAQNLQPDESAFVVGMPQIRATSWQVGRQDLQYILPLLVVVTIAVALLVFRSYTALALSLLLTSLTTAICLGLQLLLGVEISALVALIVPVVWAIATLDAFHLYSRTA